MRKVFLDVGAHNGQTLQAVLTSPLKFDLIFCFEPVKQCWPKLEKLVDHRVRILKFGLWNADCEMLVHQAGRKGAGLWQKEKDAWRDDETQMCQFRKASSWFRRHVQREDEVYLKLNCEGAECDIIDNLLDSEELDKVNYMMIDLDAHKIASMRHREDELIERLKVFSFPHVAYSHQVMKGATHQDRINSWLAVCKGT